MKDLDWNNYLEILEYISHNNYVEKWMSTIALVTYSYYGLDVKFYITENKEIIFFINVTKSTNANDQLKNQWLVSQIFYFENSDINNLKNEINKQLMILNNRLDHFYYNISQEMINFLGLPDNLFQPLKYVSNYIYPLQNLKTFAGKKMQKKRNHLNFFIKQNHNYEIKNIKEVDQKEILEYFEYHMHEFSDEYRKYELDIYKELITNQMHKSSNFSGIVIYIDNKIVAVTLGYLNRNIYEIIIEKANKNIDGLYQFLIKSNLEINDINCEFIDRQDDAGIEALAKSKHSYHPLHEILRYFSIDVIKY